MRERFMTTVAEIVTADVRCAEVLERFGVDFCCGGRHTLADACRAAGADTDEVVRALDALPEAPPDGRDVTHASIPELVDHIVSTHHAYVRTSIPTITAHLAKLVEVHGQRHPELHRIATCFGQMGDELSQHMMKEERVLFPYLNELAAPRRGDRPRSPFGTVENPIRMMEREHNEAGSSLRLLRELTRGYETPSDGCTTYALTMRELQTFERDLHQHIHLENNVLFPAAVRLERERLGSPEA
jgi:regulator of cell morphogenesis and NO signaling